MNLKFKELSKKNWKDFETLFGDKGACGGCWCMYWRLNSREYKTNKGEGNKRLMKNLVAKNNIPGILAYLNSEPVGWCSFSERTNLPRLSNSRILKAVDDKPILSIICFFIKREFRNKGISTQMLTHIEKIARKKKIKVLEGYPVDTSAKYPDAFAWTGIASSFINAGFTEIVRRSEHRPIMRKYLS